MLTRTHLVVWGIQTFISLLLFVAGVGKLMNVKEFKKYLKAYNLLPDLMLPTVSWIIPVFELVTGVALLFRLWPAATPLLAAGLFGLYAFAVSWNLLRGRQELPCGCFGTKSKPISWHLVSRNGALVGLCLLVSKPNAHPVPGVSLVMIYLASLAWRLIIRYRQPGSGGELSVQTHTD